MRWLLPILFSLLAGCPAPSSHPYDECDDSEPCIGDEYACIGFRCIPQCDLTGDCDRGYRCIDGRCLAECVSQADCQIGTCDPVGDGRRGDACLLRDLPQCAADDHCGFGVCIDGTCEQRCDWEGQCGVGRRCEFVRDGYGYCVDDPD